MNANGNNLPNEERRKLREQEAARQAAEIREGLMRAYVQTVKERQAIENRIIELSIEGLRKAREEGKLPPSVLTKL